MGQVFIGLRTTLVLFALACAACTTAARASDDFKLLRIDGRVVRWHTLANSTLVLTYAIADRNMQIGDFDTCGEVTSPSSLLSNSQLKENAFQKAAERAFDQWQRSVNVRFIPASSSAQADIVIGVSTSPRGIAFTDLTLAPPSQMPDATRAIRASVICLNPEKSWKIGFGGRADQYDVEHVISHEIGHVLGLDHPSTHGHVMSFRYSEARRELSAGDRLGAVQLYGSKPAN